MSMAGFIKELEKGLKHPAYLLYAGEEFLLKEALSAVKRTIPEEGRDFLYSSFDADSPAAEKNIEQFIDILYEVPFFGGAGGGSSRQVAALENSQKLAEKEAAALERYLRKPSPDSLLIILYVSDKGRIKAAHKDKLSLARAVPLDVRESDIPRWIKEKAKSMGVAISDGAVHYLLGATGPELGLLSAEVEKLAAAGKKTIAESDIRELTKGSGGYDAFDLTDALRAKDADRVMRIFASIRDEVAPEALLGAINWQYQARPLPDGRRMARVYEILNESDLRLKSSGSYCPMEEMLFKLLRV